MINNSFKISSIINVPEPKAGRVVQKGWVKRVPVPKVLTWWLTLPMRSAWAPESHSGWDSALALPGLTIYTKCAHDVVPDQPVFSAWGLGVTTRGGGVRGSSLSPSLCCWGVSSTVFSSRAFKDRPRPSIGALERLREVISAFARDLDGPARRQRHSDSADCSLIFECLV